jgi:hypothetical protein
MSAVFPSLSVKHLLRFDGCLDRTRGGGKRNKERISLSVNLVAPTTLEGLPQERPMACQDMPVSLPQSVQELGRSFDVGE